MDREPDAAEPADPELFRKFAAMGRQEVQRRMIACTMPPDEHWQANLWLNALQDWTDPDWRQRRRGLFIHSKQPTSRI